MKLFKRTSLKVVKDNSSKYRIKKLINFFGYLIVFIGILLIFNSHLSGLGTALGVAGAGIAFASQEVLVSIAGYIAIFTINFIELVTGFSLVVLRVTLSIWDC